MLTIYSHKSPFKKKLTVMVIWAVALALSFLLIKIVTSEGTTFLTKILPLIIGLFMIAGILLRCKIARGFTLVALYFLALFPVIATYLADGAYILFIENNALFTDNEVLITNIVWGLLFIIPIYFFSNNQSMEIFYIQSNPKEHIFFILGAVGLIFLYVQFFI